MGISRTLLKKGHINKKQWGGRGGDDPLAPAALEDVIGCFDWKIAVFQKTVGGVYFIFKKLETFSTIAKPQI